MLTAQEAIVFTERSYEEFTFRVENMEVLVEDNCIAFRGFYSNHDKKMPFIKDLYNSLNALPKYSIATGIVPAFLYIGAKKLINDILNRVDLSKPVHMTGHSYGGGLALVCAAMLKGKGVKIGNVFTFGAPRTGELSILEFDNIFLYKNGGDFVTSLPPLYKNPREHIQLGKPESWYYDHLLECYKININRLLHR